MGRPLITDEEIRAARAAGRLRHQQGPLARSARHEPETGRIVLELTNGCVFAFPAELGQGLTGASTDELSEVEIVMDGEGLHWERLDADLLVPELVSGVFGSQRWMRQIAHELGRRGGRVRSEAKAAAARRNGRKGGRPRKRRGP